jgi:thiol-disulfide isomerase/thioredoxin
MRSGRKPLIAFWSMYCQACVQKFDAMIAVQKKYGHQGLTVISVNTDGEYKRGEKEIRDFVAGYERQHNVTVNFPVLYDERNWLPQAMGIEFLPTILTVDPQSRVLEFYQKFGEVDEEDIVRGISGLAERMLAAYAAAPAPAAPASSNCPQKH